MTPPDLHPIYNLKITSVNDILAWEQKYPQETPLLFLWDRLNELYPWHNLAPEETAFIASVGRQMVGRFWKPSTSDETAALLAEVAERLASLAKS